MTERVKIFSGLNLEEVEKEVNNWIETNGYKIINVAAASGGYGIKIVVLFEA
jgi:hypothetical protein